MKFTRTSFPVFTLALGFIVLAITASANAQTDIDDDTMSVIQAAYRLNELEAYEAAEKTCNRLLESSEDFNPYAKAVIFDCLGRSLNGQKEYQQAIRKFEKAIQFGEQVGEPVAIVFDSRVALGWLHSELGKPTKALEQLRLALRIDVDDKSKTRVHNSIAWILATHPDNSVHDGANAVYHATLACTLTEFNDPGRLDTLAAAYARAGDFDQAIEWQEKALGHSQFTEVVGDEDVQEYVERLKLYQLGKSYTEQKE